MQEYNFSGMLTFYNESLWMIWVMIQIKSKDTYVPLNYKNDTNQDKKYLLKYLIMKQ